MFYVNEDVESRIEKEVQYATDTLRLRMKSIFTERGLQSYIIEDKDALDNLISIMNVSSEKFKRVITTLRLEKGHEISSEWDLSKIRAMMIERPAFMEEVCHLLREGATDPKYKKMIPGFYLENFVINESTKARLSNPDDLRRLIKKSVEGRYNINVGTAYFKAVQKKVDRFCFEEGLTYAVKKEVPLIGQLADFAIPNEKNPSLIIMLSYNITTSSTQTRYKESAEKVSTTIRNYNYSADKPVAFVNILDGAGWVGRQSDLRAIYMCSTYILHLSTIDNLKLIIKKYC